MKGKINIHRFKSELLKGNPLRDPYIRDIIVYIPEKYSSSKTSGYPTIFLLPAFGNDSYSTIKRDPFSPTIYERLESLVGMKKCGEMIIVVINCFNSLGGSQYINSDAIGKYQDYFIEEIVPFIDNKYNVGSRALLGKSSGGFGAITIGMQYPEVFAAIAAHSFDSAFEYCYLPDFTIAHKVLKKYESIKNWYTNFWNKENKSQKEDFTTLNIISMAAHYSPNVDNPDMNIDLPFDIHTGEFKDDVWKLWKEFDPINNIEKFKENLNKINLLYFDCGINDEFNLNIGNKVFSERCIKLQIKHEYQEFDGGHSGTNYRFNISLEKIYKSIL